MKRLYTIFLVFFAVSYTLPAQTFEPVDTVIIPVFKEINGEFADLNNDGSLEILIFGKDTSNMILPLALSYEDEFWKIDTLVIDTLGSTRYKLSDVNNDNRIDIVGISRKAGKSALTVFYQTGPFVFGVSDPLDTLFTEYFQVEDLNHDGYKELLYTYPDAVGYHLNILSQESGAWQKDTTLLSVPYGPQLVFDFDNNNFKDIFITGTDSFSQAFSMLFSNKNDALTVSESAFLELKDVVLTLGDYNADGLADILGAGIGSDSLFHTQLYISGNNLVGVDSLSLDSLGIVREADYFMADFNSDGLTDMVLKGLAGDASVVNTLLTKTPMGGYAVEVLDTVFTLGAIQRFADFDCDGDLDKFLISPGIDSLDSQLKLYRNTSPDINTPPGIPPRFAAFQIENQIKLFWEGVPDDHTPEKSLTYDVYIAASGSLSGIMLPSFDLPTRKRLLVKEGNNGYNTEIAVQKIEPGLYNYGIQTLDNAFHNSGCLDGGICSGSFVYCEELGSEEIMACIGETVTLNAKNANTGWYSLRMGFLGFSEAVSIKVMSSDTIYNDASGDVPCFERRRWIIKPEKVKLDFHDVETCKNDTLQFKFAQLHDSISWTSLSKGLLSASSEFELFAETPDTIKVEVYKSGCMFSDTFNLAITAPEMTVSGSQYKIYGGQSVQIEASGAESYLWTPGEGLDNTLVANPVASPLINTTYTVIGTGAKGCEVKDSVLIMVEHGAFVPSLFTPNEDGKNDVFLVYGIAQAADFSFQVYNRSGALVYQTNDAKEATVVGWDGLVSGKPQANGVYYWKVSGIFPDGKPVLLNGKESGAIHLIR